MKVEKLANLTAANEKALMAIWLAGNLDAHPFIGANYWQDQVAEVSKQFEKATIYVVLQDELIVGFAVMKTHYLAAMFVKPGYRDEGIGSLLLFALKSDYTQIRLSVYEKNSKAVRFFQNHDFAINDRSVNPETDEVELKMKWKE